MPSCPTFAEQQLKQWLHEEQEQLQQMLETKEEADDA